MTPPHHPNTLYLSAASVAALVARQGLASTFRGMARAIEEDFLRWNEFDKCARVASHSADGVIELMPIADACQYAFKYVNGHPNNHARSLPTVMAFGVLADVASGRPLLLSELTLTTAIRTAATSALAARVLARPGSRRMAIIGNGAQSEFQALAFHHLLGIDAFHLFDIDPQATAKLMANLAAQGLQAQRFDSIGAAVAGCDIVTTITADKARATIITPQMVEPGMHINGVGGDCPGKTELHADVLRGAAVFCEYTPQTRIEGDIQQLPADFPVTELWQVLAGHAPGRSDGQQVTVFDSVGFALEDFAALRYLHEVALAQGMGEPLGLIPDLPDPKNLFGFIGDHAQAPMLYACAR
ncbi:MAG: ornithine cyclodeaminase [Pseudomonadota bacterium]